MLNFKPNRIPRKPRFYWLDYVDTIHTIAKELAEHQHTTGFLDQTGSGGSPWSPEIVELELDQLRYSRRI